jgi:hypothetical protein
LLVNYDKSQALPIRCSANEVEVVTSSLACPIGEFPCKYLGLPLSLAKLRKRDVQPILDKLAKKLSFWKARLLSCDGRVAYVQVIMTSSLIYHLMALDLDPWALQFADRLRRGFLWAGKQEARGGHCLVAWEAVCKPKALGGLGFHNLKWLNASLCSRWLWFQKSDASRPWSGLDFAVLPEAHALFDASVKITIGSGDRVLFWEDPWINGVQVSAIAPALLKLVRPGLMRSRTVQQGFLHNAWVRDVAGELTVDAVVQFLRLWTAVHTIEVRGTGADKFRWKWTASGKFSTRSAYRMFFAG